MSVNYTMCSLVPMSVSQSMGPKPKMLPHLTMSNESQGRLGSYRCTYNQCKYINYISYIIIICIILNLTVGASYLSQSRHERWDSTAINNYSTVLDPRGETFWWRSWYNHSLSTKWSYKGIVLTLKHSFLCTREMLWQCVLPKCPQFAWLCLVNNNTLEAWNGGNSSQNKMIPP